MRTTRNLTTAIAAFFWALAATSVSTVDASSAHNVALVQAIHAIRRQERAVENIRITATSSDYGQIYDPKTKKFVWCKSPVDRYMATAIFDGLPLGRFRGDVPLEQLVGPYGHLGRVFVDSYIVAYNGRVGTYLQTAMASVGTTKLFPLNHGRISGKMPRERGTLDGATGWTCSIFGFTAGLPEGYHPRFSKFISPGQKRVSVSARWERWLGRRYLQVARIGWPLGKDVFLLDPRRGYSIVRCDHYGWQPMRNAAGHVYAVPTKQVQWRFRASGFFEPARGVFYPRKLVYKQFASLRDGTLLASGRVTISKVIVNDPKVNAGTWVVKFPRGALIQDMATGRYIQVGGTPEQQLKEIEAAVKAAR